MIASFLFFSFLFFSFLFFSFLFFSFLFFSFLFLQSLQSSVSALLQTVLTVKCLEFLYGRGRRLSAAFEKSEKWAGRQMVVGYYFTDFHY